MFLWRKYRDRMIGLIGAYVVLITGVLASGSLDDPPEMSAPAEAVQLTSRPEPRKADECSSALLARSDSVC
jgi:hypothetical protein